MSTTENKITVYKGNTKNFTCDVSGLTDLDGYTPYFTVKSKMGDSQTLISKEGSVNNLSLSFELSYLDTSLNADTYYYDIVIDSSIDDKRFTVVQDKFIVLNSVKY